MKLTDTERAIVAHVWDTANAARDALRANPDALWHLADRLHNIETITRGTIEAERAAKATTEN